MPNPAATPAPIIYWFRNDLRLTDLPGLQAAIKTGRPVIPCYILDDDSPGEWKLGAASRWWLHHSLAALSADIGAMGGRLLFKEGPTQAMLTELLAETGATAVYCSRSYEPWASALEAQLHAHFEREAIEIKRFRGNLLFEPTEIQNKSGLPFKVFTPFWKHCLTQPAPHTSLPTIDSGLTTCDANSSSLEALNLLPTQPNWASHWSEFWTPGEAGALGKLEHFLAKGIDNYDEGRNHPAQDNTSKLSAHLHFGELSPRQLWHAVRHAADTGAVAENQVAKFLSELGWREFSHHLLFHFPTLPEQPFKSEFSAFPWLGSPAALEAWQTGNTGYPIVDAGMRELWHTGTMHNRVRMIVASFLTKHLLIPWQAGERWFWDTLVDADLANNACGWQWVAGSGADASPYFRVFNPTLQGHKFDAAGDYVRHWVPEIAALPDNYLHEPATAPTEVLAEAGIALGKDYPEPMVDHRAAREAALAAYGSIRAA